ncbi:hypothetical protein HAX54_027813, partial [Datura stramonium]|nr:hypothetical protein [Datura stramonium]
VLLWVFMRKTRKLSTGVQELHHNLFHLKSTRWFRSTDTRANFIREWDCHLDIEGQLSSIYVTIAQAPNTAPPILDHVLAYKNQLVAASVAAKLKLSTLVDGLQDLKPDYGLWNLYSLPKMKLQLHSLSGDAITHPKYYHV